MMYRQRRAGIIIEAHAYALECALVGIVVAIDNFLRSDAFFVGGDKYTHAMLVRAANEDHVFLLCAEIAHIHIRRKISASEMSEMDIPIRVRQRRRYKSSFMCI